MLAKMLNYLLTCNNNLPLIMVKTNCSTLHTVCNVQQSATQGSNDTTHGLSRRTAATTRFSPVGIGCQKQTAPSYLPTIRSGGPLLRKHSPDGCVAVGGTPVFGRRTDPPALDLQRTGDHYVGKQSAEDQPTRPTQPFILSGSINE